MQRKTREMQDSWYSKKAVEIQSYTDQHNTKRLYEAIKALYGPQPSGSPPLLSADGTQLFTERNQILERWAEHFDSVLNRPASINDEAIARLPQVAINEELANLPNLDSEVEKAIDQLSKGKSPGPDGIPAEVSHIRRTGFGTETDITLPVNVDTRKDPWRAEKRKPSPHIQEQGKPSVL